MTGDASWLLVVDATVEPDVEAEWNRWYDEVHLPEIADCAGFRSAARYVSDVGGGRRYLTLYVLDGPEALDGADFRNRRGWGEFGAQVQATVRLFHRRESS